MYRTNKGKTWSKGDLCYYVHDYNELRNPLDPIWISVINKIEGTSNSKKWNEIHLTKEIEEEYISTQANYKILKQKFEELQSECKILESKYNLEQIMILSLNTNLILYWTLKLLIKILQLKY